MIAVLVGVFLALQGGDEPPAPGSGEVPPPVPEEHSRPPAATSPRALAEVEAPAPRPAAPEAREAGEPAEAAEPSAAPPRGGAPAEVERAPATVPRTWPEPHPRPSPPAERRPVPGPSDAPPRDPSYVLRERVREGFQDAIPELRGCYETLLAGEPDLSERLIFEMAVYSAPDGGDSGEVELVSVTSEELEIDEVSCFATAIEDIDLPPPNEGEDSYTVNYPVLLQPE